MSINGRVRGRTPLILRDIADGIDIHLVHSRCPFVGLYPLPGLSQDVLPTNLIVEKREPPFRLLLGHSV